MSGLGEPGDDGSVDPLQCLVELAPAGQESCCRSQAAIPSGSSVALTLKPMVAMTRVQKRPRMNYVRREQKCRLVKDFSDYHPQIPAF